MIQPLEPRRMLAATAILDGGIVKIAGTPQADHIGVRVAIGNATDFLVVTAEGDEILAVPLADVDAVTARLHDGDDAFRSAPDVNKPMTISGDGGNDVIATGAGRDVSVGGLGNDLFIAGRGPDDYIGGPGADSISYADYTVGVRVTLDNLPNDGALLPATTNANGVTEGDNVRRDVERVIGGSGNDHIAVGPAPTSNTDAAAAPYGAIIFEGRAGNDVLVASPPNSTTPAVSAKSVATTALMSAPLDVNAEINTSGDVETISPEESFDEVAAFNAVRVILRGGEGNDRLVGSPFNDLLDPGAGNDTALGNNGHDFFLFGLGNDDWSGGDGIDTANFADAPGGVIVTLDNLPNDGLSALASPIGSNVRPDIENVIGSRFNDYIGGSERRNRLDGGPGDDVIHGNAGDDTIIGGLGHDRLFGDAGDDWFFARDGQHDVVNGGDGNDRAVVDSLDNLVDVEVVAP